MPEELKSICYSIIVELADFFYTEFQRYMEKLSAVSAVDLTSNDESLSIQATEMWNQFAKCEIILAENRQIEQSYMEPFRSDIVPKMMLNLMKNDGIEEDDEGMQNTIFVSTSIALTNINKVLGQKLEAMNMEFIEGKNPNPKNNFF